MARCRVYVFTFLIVTIFAGALHAAEVLQYDQGISERQRYEIRSLLSRDFLQIARVDLNADNMDEFIVRTGGCVSHERAIKQEPCTFFVLAETPDGLMRLGQVKARAVIPGHEYTHGVRNILVFQQAANDFDYALYIWEPEQARYILKE